MPRTRLTESLKQAMLAKDEIAVSTIRLVLAALKDRDIAERAKRNTTGIGDEQIASLLQAMIKQRRESIELFRQGGREDLARREADEIRIIEGFLPAQLGDEETEAAVSQVIEAVGAHGLKDMGRVMATLKQHYEGRMDFAKASLLVRKRLV